VYLEGSAKETSPMKLLKKALLVTDFGEASKATLRTAATLAAVFGSEIHPLHVLREAPELPPEEGIDDARLIADRELRKLTDELEAQNISFAPPVVAQGIPSEVILEHANARDVNVILMGAGERGSEGAVRLGTTAERVVRRSSKPVWVVRPGSRESVKRVICAVDFSDHSRRALTNGIHLARNFAAELLVLTVLEPLEELVPFGAMVSSAAPTTYAQSVQDRFESLLQGHDLHGVKFEERIGHGRPAEVIRRVAAEQNADLLVMGSAGKSGFARFFLGSVAGSVLRNAPCSVLTVKSESAVRVEFEAKVDELKSRFDRGTELLDKGLPDEALVELEALRTENPMAAPVWEALAVAHMRLGHTRQAAACASRAEYLRDTLWERLVESEIRRQHPLFEKD
jgi:nucleotide-binding universal stress UspA family protein